MNKKIITPAVALIIVLALGVLAWQFWPERGETPAPTAETKISLVTTRLAAIPKGHSVMTYDGYGGFISYDLIFSPDKTRVAFRTQKEGKQYLVVDGEQFGPYAHVRWLPSAYTFFSPDGQRFAFTASEEGEEEKDFFILNGEKFSRYEADQEPAFSPDSPDSQRFSFEQREGKKLLILDGKEFGPYDEVGHPAFSPDKQRFAFEARRGDAGYFLILDGKEFGPYEGVLDFAFSPDSQRFACEILKEGRRYIVVDGKELGPYGRVYDWGGHPAFKITFSPNSQRLVFMDQKEMDRWYFIVDGKRFGPYDGAWNFAFSPNSQRFAFEVLKEGRRHIVLDEAEFGPYESVQEFVFSPNSQRLAFGALKEGKWRIVLDGKEVFQEFDRIYTSPFFDPESRYIAFGALIGNEIWWIAEGARQSWQLF